jgi:hypothetical protein
MTDDELQGKLEERDRRIAELKDELERERDLSYRLGEQVRESCYVIDSWKYAFDMVLNDEGMWVWTRDFVEGDEWFVKYRDLLKKWNQIVPEYNARVAPAYRNVGRPLAASAAQEDRVRDLHKQGKSLRWIAEETNLGLHTVRTIVGRINGTDRTTLKHLKRIDPERAKQRAWEARSRTRKHLPKRIHELRRNGDQLLKEAKGSKR